MNKHHHTLLLTLFGFACGGSDPSNLRSGDLTAGPFGSGDSKLITEQDARTRAIDIAGGAVLSIERKMERGLSVFEVKLSLEAGAVIEVKIDEATGQIVEIEGESGPFSYEIAPNGFISLQDAVSRAIALHPGAALVRYELELDDGLRWKYEIDLMVEGILYEVELDARTGDLLEDSVDDDAQHDAWDDNGGTGETEPGDDNGGHGDEPGDDHGG